jgi:hypothetical protein
LKIGQVDHCDFYTAHQDGQLLAAGATLDMNADRVILKRVVLTGYPVRFVYLIMKLFQF